MGQHSTSHAILRTLLQHAPVGVAFIDRNRRFRLVTDDIAQMHGLSVSELEGKLVADVAPQLWPSLKPTYDAVLDRDETITDVRVVGEVIATPGVQRVWISSYYPVHGEDGVTLGMTVLFKEVTDNERAEAALRERDALLRRVLDHNPTFITVKDRDGRYVLANEAFLRAHGTLAIQVLGQTDASFNPHVPEAALESDRRVIDHKQAEEIPAESVTLASGETRWLQTTKIPLLGEAGACDQVLTVSVDVTDRRRAEGLLRSVVDHAVDGIITIDETGIVQSLNPAAVRLFGYETSEVIDRNVRMLMPQPYQREHDQYVANYVRTQQPKVIGIGREVSGKRKDGTTFPLRLAVSEFIFDGKRLFVGTITDITRAKRMEEQLRQTQKMDAVGQLAGGVAHDFNNLLTVINGYSEILIESLDAADPRRELWGEVIKAGEKAAGLTRQLLAFSRQQVLEPRILSVNAVIRDTEKMLRRLIGEDVILTTVLDPEVGTIKADPGQIEQVLVNLVINARDAMPRGGKLTIETSNVVIDQVYLSSHPQPAAGDYVLLTVTDSGVGMDVATRERIFEPFFTTKPVGKGTGLGLSTVHGIVQQSGGQVQVYSEVGIGTTFKIYLPSVAAAATPLAAAGPTRAMPQGNETILLTEDEDAVRALARHVLRSCGYTVLEAANGQAAIELAGSYEGKIDLLVSDVVMPLLGGRDLAEQLVVKRPGCRILFLSGYTNDAVVRHGVLEAEFDFLQKPFTPMVLATKVRKVLDDPR